MVSWIDSLISCGLSFIYLFIFVVDGRRYQQKISASSLRDISLSHVISHSLSLLHSQQCPPPAICAEESHLWSFFTRAIRTDRSLCLPIRLTDTISPSLFHQNEDLAFFCPASPRHDSVKAALFQRKLCLKSLVVKKPAGASTFCLTSADWDSQPSLSCQMFSSCLRRSSNQRESLQLSL